ncbi:hypothetical protein N8J89_34145 [Crossiella sp. CA-258035]|uniref:hypothetical protein n=1 Tax=Crossiella sp. CA-258035 TaxID=2981138 RepID=UPI0024BC0AEC|nr:hypothetical protein [Crossiella sp. CA-258035]WHT18111.1 hypothetical protein N8J89_34145 [Crossiella sp. CA-258035]
MAKVVSSIAQSVLVEQRYFTLHDARGPEPLAPPEPVDEQLVHADLGHAVFRSAESGHYAAVRAELWDAEPGTPEDGFDAQGRVDILAGSAELVLGPVLTVSEPARLALPAPGRYRIDASARGRTEVRALGPGSYAHGIESWVIRIWPVR